MRLRAEWITEVSEEQCIVCREVKKGKFLIIHIEKKYLAICEECVKK